MLLDTNVILLLLLLLLLLLSSLMSSLCRVLTITCRSQWPRDLRRRSTAVRLLGLWVRIPPRAWMSVSCECCVLSGRGLCDELVPRPEKSCRVWCVWVWSWSLEKWGGLGPQGAVQPLEKKINNYIPERNRVFRVYNVTVTGVTWLVTVEAERQNRPL
jgi:hypothetical protein